jgi:hypothetical protein
MKLFREVKCSDRLPEREDVYFVYYNKTVDGYMKGHEYFNPDKERTVAFWRSNYHIWLEPYELPTDEEIRKEAATYDNAMTSIAEGIWMPMGFIEGAQWVLSKLKGENNV